MKYLHKPLSGLSLLSLFVPGIIYAQTIDTSFLHKEILASSVASNTSSLATATGSASVIPKTQSWMSPDVGAAWGAGYSGKGTTITIVDDHSNQSKFTGNLNGTVQNQGHGQWTSEQAGLIAYSATINRQDFNANSGSAVALVAKGLNVINASYAMYANGAYQNYTIGFAKEETSMINYAKNGQAIIVKAAGNDGINMGTVNSSGNFDALNKYLKGSPTTIYAGALSTNGTTTSQASMASYSNKAGSDLATQKQFLVVGVDSSKMGIAGTSFAAPIISGYASIVGSKFTTATPTQVTNQLLNTARTDTLKNYSAAVYGRGEASLSRALAPTAIK
jgi:subtilisin family serine protease